MSDLNALWCEICNEFNFPSQSFGAIYGIMQMYGSGGLSPRTRSYHNWGHIESCIDELFQFAHSNELIDLSYGKSGKRIAFLRMSYALIMHDLIYDPRSSMNEENSAWIASIVAGSDIASPLILATKSHGHQVDLQSAIVCDVDMSILGKSEKEYDRYSSNTRMEYSSLTDSGWTYGRSLFLKKCLDSRIFNTGYFQAKYEERARANILRELNSLGVEYKPLEDCP